MHVVLPIWLVPLSLTVLIWVAAIFWPSADEGVSYQLRALVLALVRFSAASAATLLVWLAYLIWLVVAGGA
ncbi:MULTISPECIES: hypothetical protein [unclassified Mesorhizobium]|uniref:hypothetical protein n=1 Tax=unclassified Mesorhizobium TaxID=325217 RepID=UPI0003CE4F25|nr:MULTISPECIES: hypothetical protein [unclassified Mesorhizobium]ESY49013.1 hypothetical protein X745_27950 [Mesorhizobium sp. LNJC374B00]ESY52749.1 hypothetical protein X744_28650 [Mesorhizobium sp. LNJC372A00]WJI81471.1 hypothetical protein NLY34_01540 [Mesorhizobium sp. C374B]WJI87990.1 hypothetical protein NLY42_03955 [Mesorhizobium sp. C372A]